MPFLPILASKFEEKRIVIPSEVLSTVVGFATFVPEALNYELRYVPSVWAPLCLLIS